MIAGRRPVDRTQSAGSARPRRGCSRRASSAGGASASPASRCGRFRRRGAPERSGKGAAPLRYPLSTIGRAGPNRLTGHAVGTCPGSRPVIGARPFPYWGTALSTGSFRVVQAGIVGQSQRPEPLPAGHLRQAGPPRRSGPMRAPPGPAGRARLPRVRSSTSTASPAVASARGCAAQ